eukprot:5192411-Pleurochrysis_carterae.AAC.5
MSIQASTEILICFQPIWSSYFEEPASYSLEWVRHAVLLLNWECAQRAVSRHLNHVDIRLNGYSTIALASAC